VFQKQGNRLRYTWQRTLKKKNIGGAKEQLARDPAGQTGKSFVGRTRKKKKVLFISSKSHRTGKLNSGETVERGGDRNTNITEGVSKTKAESKGVELGYANWPVN